VRAKVTALPTRRTSRYTVVARSLGQAVTQLEELNAYLREDGSA
jgi:hypothetical protein